MKKYMILAAVALVASAACTKTEVVDNSAAKPITFAVANYVPQTKAVALQGETTTFKSYASFHANGAASGTKFFSPTNGVETITYNSSVPEWAPGHNYYWPKAENSYLNFISWYDKNGAPTTFTETSLVWNNRNIVTDDNIMFADEAWRFTSNNNPATYTAVSGVAQGVPTLFHHALAQVKFNVKAAILNDNDGTTWDVTVKTFSLASVYGSGTLSLTNADPSTPATPVAWGNTTWTPTGSAAALTKDSSSDVALTLSYDDIIDQRSVLPQTVTNSMVLTIVYNVSTKYNNVEYSNEDVTATITLNTLKNTSNVAITSWDMNKIITYNIIINPQTQKILYDPALEAAWEEVTGADYTTPAA